MLRARNDALSTIHVVTDVAPLKPHPAEHEARVARAIHVVTDVAPLKQAIEAANAVADEAIASKVSADVWGEAMADMLKDIRHGRIADGLVAGVRDVGAVLAEHFPRAEDDQNELPDRLIEV